MRNQQRQPDDLEAEMNAGWAAMIALGVIFLIAGYSMTHPRNNRKRHRRPLVRPGKRRGMLLAARRKS
jgi:hypothetical protein